MSKPPPLLLLRNLLSQPPSLRVWHRLLRVLQRAEESEQQMLVEYASQHLETWPDRLRVLDFVDESLAIWPLVRHLEFWRSLSSEDIFPFVTLPSFHLPGVSNEQNRLIYKSFHWKETARVTGLDLSVVFYQGDSQMMYHTMTSLSKRLPSLQHLKLQVSGDVQSGRADFLASLSGLKTLHLRSRCWYSRNSIFDELKALKLLTDLTIDGPHFIWMTPTQLETLSFPTSLCSLRVMNIPGIPSLKLFRKLRRLESLSLGNLSALRWTGNNITEIFPTDWEVLERLAYLQHLELKECKNLSSLEVFGALTGLKSLRLSGLVACHELKGLGRLEELEELELMGLPEVVLEELEPLSSLKHLRLQSRTPPKAGDWEGLLQERFPQLQTLDLRFPVL